jgi:hypothetical protein
LIRLSISNNAVISSAHSIRLPSSVVHKITQDPTLLSQAGPQALNITATERSDILAGYISGFRVVFILNASLAAFAAVVAFFMIHHKELIREDDAKRKAHAQQEETEMRATGKNEPSVEKEGSSKGETVMA